MKKTTPVDTRLLYTAIDLASHWSASRTTIYCMINSGLNKYGRHVNGNWIFSGRNIERWVLGLPPITSESEVTTH